MLSCTIDFQYSHFASAKVGHLCGEEHGPLRRQDVCTEVGKDRHLFFYSRCAV